MNKYYEAQVAMIIKYDRVLAKANRGLWYEEDGHRFAIIEEDGGYATYYCPTLWLFGEMVNGE